MLSTKLAQDNGVVFCHSSVIISFNFEMVRALRDSIRRFKSAQRFSIGLRSGEWGGSSIKLTPLLLKQGPRTIRAMIGGIIMKVKPLTIRPQAKSERLH